MSTSARSRTERGPTASISVESSMLAGTLLDRAVWPDARVVRVPRADLLEGRRSHVAAVRARLLDGARLAGHGVAGDGGLDAGAAVDDAFEHRHHLAVDAGRED